MARTQARKAKLVLDKGIHSAKSEWTNSHKLEQKHWTMSLATILIYFCFLRTTMNHHAGADSIMKNAGVIEAVTAASN